MPHRPLSSCTVPGCGNKVERPGRCAAHQRVYEQHNDQERGTASERGYDAECGAEREFATAQQESHNSYWDTRRRKGLDASPVNKKGRGK